jgi:hypothetical protein
VLVGQNSRLFTHSCAIGTVAVPMRKVSLHSCVGDAWGARVADLLLHTRKKNGSLADCRPLPVQSKLR